MKIFIVSSQQSCGEKYKQIIKERLPKLGFDVGDKPDGVDLIVVLYCRDVCGIINMAPFLHGDAPVILIGHCRNHRRVNGATHINASDDALQDAMQKAVDMDKTFPPHTLCSEMVA